MSKPTEMHTLTSVVSLVICLYPKHILNLFQAQSQQKSVLLHTGWVEPFQTDVLKTRLFWEVSSPELAVGHVNPVKGCEILSLPGAAIAESGLQIVVALLMIQSLHVSTWLLFSRIVLVIWNTENMMVTFCLADCFLLRGHCHNG